MATLLIRSRSVSNPLTEACDLYRFGHFTAATCVAKLVVDHAMSDLALAVRPTLKRFFAGKRLAGFLRAEGAIDGKLAEELAAFTQRAYCLMNVPTGRGVDAYQLIVRASKLRRRLREIQRGL